MSEEYPYICHPSLAHRLEIKDELSFRIAQLLWDDIAKKYSNESLDKQTVRVIPDHRQENAARSVIPSDELKPVKETAQQKIKKLSPAQKSKAQSSRVGVPSWTDEETNLIRACPDVEEAWVAYQKVYPGQRNRNAIKQKFTKVNGTPAEAKPTKPPAKSTKQRGRSLKCPYCEHVTLSPGLHRHAKFHHPKEYVTEFVADYIAGRNIPQESPPAAPQPVPAITIPAGTIVKNVRGVGRFPGCTGMVKRTNVQTGDLLIQFDKGLEWIAEKNCDVVTVPA